MRTSHTIIILFIYFFYICMWKLSTSNWFIKDNFFRHCWSRRNLFRRFPRITGKPEDYKADNFRRWPGSARLGYQPLFRKGARVHSPKSTVAKERRADLRERRKSSLSMNSQIAHLWIQFLIVRILLVHSEKQCLGGHRKRAWSEHTWCYQMTGGCEHHVTGYISTQASIFNDDFSNLFLV